MPKPKKLKESEWERVKRMRQEDHPLVKGGRHHKIPDYNPGNIGGKGIAGTARKAIKGY